MPDKKTYTETELTKLLSVKNEQAYHYLYDNYSGALYGVITKVLGDNDDALDVLQDAFVKIWNNIDKYDVEKGRLFTWMLNITRNLAIDFTRSKQAKNNQRTNRLTPDTPLNSPESVSYTATDHIGLNKVLEGLRAEERNIIDLAYFKGFTQKEIADILKIPLGTVKTRARKALSELKIRLK